MPWGECGDENMRSRILLVATTHWANIEPLLANRRTGGVPDLNATMAFCL
jgi:hypothetical protein